MGVRKGRGKGLLVCSMEYGVSFTSDGNILNLDCGVSCTTP